MLALVAWSTTGRTISTVGSSITTPPIALLDFDGTICDSEPELTRTAWRTARELWPREMSAAAVLDPMDAGVRRAWVGGEWSELEGAGPDGLPHWLRQKVRMLRPAVQSSFESVLLMRLCADEAVQSAGRATGERPLAVGEITSNWGPELRDVLLARYGLRREDAVAALARERAAWLDSDPESWLAANSFYDGALTALRDAVADGSEVRRARARAGCGG